MKGKGRALIESKEKKGKEIKRGKWDQKKRAALQLRASKARQARSCWLYDVASSTSPCSTYFRTFFTTWPQPLAPNHLLVAFCWVSCCSCWQNWTTWFNKEWRKKTLVKLVDMDLTTSYSLLCFASLYFGRPVFLGELISLCVCVCVCVLFALSCSLSRSCSSSLSLLLGLNLL